MVTMSPELTAETVAKAVGKLLNKTVVYELRDAGDTLLFSLRDGSRWTDQRMPPAHYHDWFNYLALMVHFVAHYIPDRAVTFTRDEAEAALIVVMEDKAS
jgi:hypothetical protein